VSPVFHPCFPPPVSCPRRHADSIHLHFTVIVLDALLKFAIALNGNDNSTTETSENPLEDFSGLKKKKKSKKTAFDLEA